MKRFRIVPHIYVGQPAWVVERRIFVFGIIPHWEVKQSAMTLEQAQAIIEHLSTPPKYPNP